MSGRSSAAWGYVLTKDGRWSWRIEIYPPGGLRCTGHCAGSRRRAVRVALKKISKLKTQEERERGSRTSGWA